MNRMDPFDNLNDRSITSSSGTVNRLVIFLHGYGADGADLLSIGQSLKPVLPDCAFAAPDAPFPCEAGYGRQWFGLQDRSPSALQSGVEQAMPYVAAYLKRQQTLWQLEDRDIYLVGFSQGTMMALAAGLAWSGTLGGIVGYSGAYLDTGPVVSRPPVLLVHGTADSVVGFEMLAASNRRLKADGVTVEALAIPGLGHSIDPQGIQAGLGFLGRRPRPAPAPSRSSVQ